MNSPLPAPAVSGGDEASRALRIALLALKLGADYAIKIRLPHAVVMTALFGDAAAREPLALWRRAAGLAWQHGKGLALFAFVYKLAIGVGRSAYTYGGIPVPLRPGSPARPWHAAAAGALAATVAWSRYSHLSYQLVLYLLSRLLIGAVRHAAKRGVAPFTTYRFEDVFPALAVTTWALTMYLFETDAASLHPSLAQSMREIYRCAGDGSSVDCMYVCTQHHTASCVIKCGWRTALHHRSHAHGYHSHFSCNFVCAVPPTLPRQLSVISRRTFQAQKRRPSLPGRSPERLLMQRSR